MTHHTQLMSFVMLAVGLLSFAAIYVLSKRTNFGVVSMVALIIGGVLGVISLAIRLTLPFLAPFM